MSAQKEFTMQTNSERKSAIIYPPTNNRQPQQKYKQPEASSYELIYRESIKNLTENPPPQPPQPQYKTTVYNINAVDMKTEAKSTVSTSDTNNKPSYPEIQQDQKHIMMLQQQEQHQQHQQRLLQKEQLKIQQQKEQKRQQEKEKTKQQQKQLRQFMQLQQIQQQKQQLVEQQKQQRQQYEQEQAKKKDYLYTLQSADIVKKIQEDYYNQKSASSQNGSSNSSPSSSTNAKGTSLFNANYALLLSKLNNPSISNVTNDKPHKNNSVPYNNSATSKRYENQEKSQVSSSQNGHLINALNSPQKQVKSSSISNLSMNLETINKLYKIQQNISQNELLKQRYSEAQSSAAASSSSSSYAAKHQLQQQFFQQVQLQQQQQQQQKQKQQKQKASSKTESTTSVYKYNISIPSSSTSSAQQPCNLNTSAVLTQYIMNKAAMNSGSTSNVQNYQLTQAQMAKKQSRAEAIVTSISKQQPSSTASQYQNSQRVSKTSTSQHISSAILNSIPAATQITLNSRQTSTSDKKSLPELNRITTQTSQSSFTFPNMSKETTVSLKPKISSPAPATIYGKPDAGYSVSPDSSRTKYYALQQYDAPQNFAKSPEQSPEVSKAQPPPAHCSEQTAIENKVNYILNYRSQSKDPKTFKPEQQAVPTMSQDQILNLDTKTLLKHKLNTQKDLQSQATTMYRSNPDLPSYNSKKIVKIEQRVDYVSPPAKSLVNENKYKHNVVWKQQPSVTPIKAEEQPADLMLPIRTDMIEEQKRKILENLKAVQSGHAGTSGETSNPLNNYTNPLALAFNSMNMEIYKYYLAESAKLKAAQQNKVWQNNFDTQRYEPYKMERLNHKTKEPKKRIIKIKKSDKIKGEPYLQSCSCCEVPAKLARCRECRLPPAQRTKDASNIFCRFFAFRKLVVDERGLIKVAGFANPAEDAKIEDVSLWTADLIKVPEDLTVEKSKFLLGQVGYKFCELYHQEKEAYYEHLSENKTVAWKQAVEGIREMCDVCETTLFNYHWVCTVCGFVVCIDCYKGRKYGLTKKETSPRDRDDYNWIFCTHKVPHEQNKLMLTQIIPGDCLYKLVRQVHGMCALMEIPLNCDCPFSKESLFRKMKDKLEFLYPFTFSNGEGQSESKMISVSIKSIESHISSTDESTINCNVTFKRELSKDATTDLKVTEALEKQTYSFDGFQRDIKNEKDGKTNETILSNKLDSKTFNLIVKQLLKFDKSINITSYFEQHMNEKCPESESLSDFSSEIVIKDTNIKNFLGDFLSEFVFLTGQNSKETFEDNSQVLEYTKHLRKYNDFQNKGERRMELRESEIIYQNIPHQWLCEGKLLRLLDSLNENNYTLFHDQWERGQPVMVSYATDMLSMELWKPQSFRNDFGEESNDLINCLNGKLIKDQQMKVFWDGFERIDCRLQDERNHPMILKLKDWPPGDDFAERLPTRYSDIMRSLPLGEYTLREGRLNLAGRLPKFFVRPDLGPKMYNAYGSALYPGKGTTNLHLDVSDAVNVMVYVSVPQDIRQESYIQKVLNVIESENCDTQTKRRIREKKELPGALWHIYHAQDADKIRLLLNKIEVEKGGSIQPNHDPIHDQKWYLDETLRRRLREEFSVEGYTIIQCSGDAIFIPAGAPHQVRNLHNCIKVAEDFVSPENVSYCFKLTNEFRDLTNTHSNHEDKLQIKNIIYHTVKDALSCLTNPLIATKDGSKTYEKEIKCVDMQSEENIKVENLQNIITNNDNIGNSFENNENFESTTVTNNEANNNSFENTVANNDSFESFANSVTNNDSFENLANNVTDNDNSEILTNAVTNIEQLMSNVTNNNDVNEKVETTEQEQVPQAVETTEITFVEEKSEVVPAEC